MTRPRQAERATQDRHMAIERRADGKWRGKTETKARVARARRRQDGCAVNEAAREHTAGKPVTVHE